MRPPATRLGHVSERLAQREGTGQGKGFSNFEQAYLRRQLIEHDVLRGALTKLADGL